MGRVSLLVEANTSIAIGNISKLGEAIKNAMAKFDSKALTTWETDAETKINKVGETINKLGETLQTFKNNLKADASFGASKALTEFKRKFEDSFKTLDNFKTYFKEGYTFGATTQVDTFKTKIAEAKEAIGALNAEVQKQTTTGANQTAKAKKDEITKLIAAAKELNKQLEKKPVLGARQAITDFEAGLKTFSQNVAQNISPALVSLNLVKTQMGELTQVLNSVQQPTWVEPFKMKMQEVVKVLQDIATAYKSVKTEIKQPVGESAARREFQLTDKQAQNLYRTTKMFYRHIRQEFKETRAAATETARAIREAMAAVQGGGTGAGGTGTATAGTRLGFGEQLWSRMRSNLYSYMTMWFGVAGAIRAANALIETHNQLVEKGRQFNQTEYEALGELNLKAGEKAPEYREAAKRLAASGFSSNKEAYQFASSAAMSGISVKEMEDIAPLFKYNIAAGGDQRALMAAVSYVKKAYGDQYSTKQIAAMILEANRNNPSAIGPTANAIQRLIKSFGTGLNIPLPDLIATLTVGSEEERDARVATMLNAVAVKLKANGLEAMVMGDVMKSRGISGYDYYKDEATKTYKFKDAELQKRLESGDMSLSMEDITHWFKGRGQTALKDTGFAQRVVLGGQELAKIAENPAEYNRILANLTAIANGDTSVLESVVKDTKGVLSVSVEETKKAIENAQGQAEANRAALEDSVKLLRREYTRKHHGIGEFTEFVAKYTDPSSNELQLVTGALQFLGKIQGNDDYTYKEQQRVKEAFINAIRAAIKIYGEKHGIDVSTESGIEKVAEKIGRKLKSVADTRLPFTGDYYYSESLYVAKEREKREAEANRKKGSNRTASEPTGGIAPAGNVKMDNQWDAEQAEQKRLENEEKLKNKKAKEDAKAALDSLPRAALNAQKNWFITDQLAIALTDTSSGMQAVKSAALGNEISSKKTGNVLGQAFYAYASDKTDSVTDKKIVEQLVASLNQGGLSVDDMGKIVIAYASSVSKETDSNEAKKMLMSFMRETTAYLKNISDGADVIQTPIVKQPEDKKIPGSK